MDLDTILNRTDVPEDVKKEMQLIILESVLAESVLKSSESKYRRLFETAKDGILILDAETGIINDVNPFLAKLLGYSAEELQRKAIWEIGAFKDIVANLAKFRELQQKEYVRYENLPLQTKDGRSVNVEFVSNVYEVDNCKVIQCNIRDNTKHLQIEKDNKQLSIVVEQTIEGIIITDLTGKVSYVNDAWCRLHDYQGSQQILGQNLAIFHTDEQMEREVKPFIKKLVELGAYKDVVGHRKKNGREFTTLMSTTLLKDLEGKPYAFAGFATDITSRIETERSLEHKSMLLASQLETSVDGILAVDELGRILLVNTRFGEMWKIPKEVLDNKDDKKMLGYIIDQLKDPSEFLARVNFLYSHPTESSREEITFADGRHFDRYSSPLRGSDGKNHGRIWYFRDITDRKNAEQALLRQERLSAIGEVAAGVAHDFNNSLQCIFGNLELALILALPTEAREYLDTVKKSAIDAAARINQLQRFAGKRAENAAYTVLNLKSVIDDSVAQSRHLWKDEMQKRGKNVHMQIKAVKDLTVLGNDAELRSVFFNLLKNSIQAMPDGGTITIDTRKEGNEAYVTVTDTGVGMDEATKLRIFQPFFTTKGLEQGRGLGMSSVYAIVQEHKGQIYVKRTAPGEGTSIELLLPYAEATLLQVKTDYIYNGSARILWVDDEEPIRILGKRLLEKMGHTADIAGSGEEALKLLAGGNGIEKYDLMITDVGMPNMSGWQLAEKTKGLYPSMKVVILTGWGSEPISDDQRSRYGVGYIIGKPAPKDMLERVIGEVLQMKQK